MQVRRIVAIAVVLGVALLPAAASASTGWQVQSTQNPGGTNGAAVNVLYSVSCASASSCTAVGSWQTGSPPVVTLAENWNGTSWQLQSSPAPAGATFSELLGVKCVSATFCVAVGDYINSSGVDMTLAESWNGTSWSVRSTPNPAGATASELDAVACTTATSCSAVGTYGTSSGANVTLAEHWNGTAWAVQATPNPSGAKVSQLLGVSCTSASACTAVGSSGPNGLAEHWNGTAWKIQSVPKPAGSQGVGLYGVKCSSSTVCTAVGIGNDAPLAERWNGTAWKIQPTPALTGSTGTGSLAAISCASASACTAVGSYRSSNMVNFVTLAEYWNGTSWAVQSTVNHSAGDFLRGVACTSATTCTAVGDYDISTSTVTSIATLAEHRT